MGKVVGLVGAASGKIGNIVYVVKNGLQIARVYQPIVSNPKSTAQSIQRAKGNLAGRISKIVPWQILEGLGNNRSNRRSRLLRLLLRNITAGQAAGNPSQINAKLMDVDFVFSEGALVPVYGVSSVTAAQRLVTVTITRSSGAAESDYASQGLLIVCVLKQASGVWEQILYRYLAPSDISGYTTNIEFGHISEGAYYASVYMAPFGTADGSRLTTVTGDLTSTATSLDAILSVGTATSSVVWGASSFVSSSNFTPA